MLAHPATLAFPPEARLRRLLLDGSGSRDDLRRFYELDFPFVLKQSFGFPDKQKLWKRMDFYKNIAASLSTVDKTAGLYAAQAATAALVARGRSGEGTVVDISMLEAAVAYGWIDLHKWNHIMCKAGFVALIIGNLHFFTRAAA